MRLSSTSTLQLLVACSSALNIAVPEHDTGLVKQPHQHLDIPAMPPSTETNNNGNDENDTPQPPLHPNVLLSDVMGRDRSINLFASFARDIASISARLDSSQQNSTVLAPLNSAIDNLPRKPWEDAAEYESLGASAYAGGDGRDRAERNMRRFVEAHVLSGGSGWAEGERRRSLLAGEGGGEGDREVWWEMKGEKRVVSLSFFFFFFFMVYLSYRYLLVRSASLLPSVGEGTNCRVSQPTSDTRLLLFEMKGDTSIRLSCE